jgi:serine/threonine protein kinase
VREIDPQLAASLARRFRLVRQLGAGGMGQVYLAEQIAVGNRPVALKILSRKLLDDPNLLPVVASVSDRRLEVVHWHALRIAHLKPPLFASAQPLLIQEGSPRKSSPPWIRRGGALATGVVGPEMLNLQAASTGGIHHPNVVTIYESGQADDGTPYIAMEFLEGESLRRP